MEFNRILKETRREKNLSQRQLAERCGVVPSVISRLESGIAVPLMEETLTSLSRELEIDEGSLMDLYLQACPSSRSMDLSKELDSLTREIMALPSNKKEQVMTTIRLIVKAQQLAAS